MLSDVVGAKAFHAGKAAHVSGVSVHDDTLVIRLVKPAADLPTRLALPGLCAVPANLPTVLHGLPYPIPSAGPYYLAERSSNVVVLKPNPNYHGPRPHRLDAIVYEMGVNVGDAVAQVAQGKVDYVEESDSALAPNTAAARRAGPRYRRTPSNWTAGFALNTRRPLFADIRLRRAVSYAIDRRVLAAGGIPTSHVLSPNFLGFRGGSGYPLSADLRIARRLIGGRHYHAVFAVGTDDAGVVYDSAVVEGVREQLAAIDISVTVLPITNSDHDHPARLAAKLARADLAQAETNASQTIDPVRYLRALGYQYLPAADRAKLERVATFTSPHREAGAAALAARLERDAVYVMYADAVIPELVSKRLGCTIDQPEYPGLDLAALCLRNTGS